MNPLAIIFFSFALLLVILYLFIRYQERHPPEKGD